MVNHINPSELQLNTANVADPESLFLDLNLSISAGFVKIKIGYKRNVFDFDIVNFPFLDGDDHRSTFYGVYISQLIRFARVFSHSDDLILVTKFWQQNSCSPSSRWWCLLWCLICTVLFPTRCLRTASNKISWGVWGGLTCLRWSSLALYSAWFLKHLVVRFARQIPSPLVYYPRKIVIKI